MLMALGSLRFSIETAAYDKLSRQSAFRWPAQERLARNPALQFTGPGEDAISLSGVVFAAWKGGAGQVDALRTAAAAGKPLLLVDGRGFIHGYWVIESVTEEQGAWLKNGAPLRQAWSLALKYYGEDAP